MCTQILLFTVRYKRGGDELHIKRRRLICLYTARSNGNNEEGVFYYCCFCCKRNVLGAVYPEGCVRAVRIGRLRSVFAVRAATLLGTIFCAYNSNIAEYYTVCLSARFSPENIPTVSKCSTFYPRSLCGKSMQTAKKVD